MPFDYLIDLCDKGTDELSDLPQSSQTITWSFKDPVGQEGDEGFRHLLQEVSDRIKLFLMVNNRLHEPNPYRPAHYRPGRWHQPDVLRVRRRGTAAGLPACLR